ncbi:hypothetical protein YB2330_000015 [Saitoella coloradoensis]
MADQIPAAEQKTVQDDAARQREREEQATLPYQWRQTLADVDVDIPIPKGTRGKFVNVVIEKQRIIVGLKGQEPILEGSLPHEIKLDESTWTIEDQSLLTLHLEKVNKAQWWPHVLTHHPAINVRAIAPENSKLSDLDGETRAMVEKMMFEQRQKQGEEAKKREVLEAFKREHPEMDFSQVEME